MLVSIKYPQNTTQHVYTQEAHSDKLCMLIVLKVLGRIGSMQVTQTCSKPFHTLGHLNLTIFIQASSWWNPSISSKIIIETFSSHTVLCKKWMTWSQVSGFGGEPGKGRWGEGGGGKGSWRLGDNMLHLLSVFPLPGCKIKQLEDGFLPVWKKEN